jgi:hypothetical protein
VCALFVNYSGQPISINIKNSAFYDNTAVFVLAISNNDGVAVSANIVNNTFSGNNAFPINIINTATEGGTMTANITNNTFAQNAQSQDLGDPNLGAINLLRSNSQSPKQYFLCKLKLKYCSELPCSPGPRGYN